MRQLESRNSFLEEQCSQIESEKRYLENQKIKYEREIRKLQSELDRMKTSPLIIGTVIDVIKNDRIIVRSSNGPQFLVNVSQYIDEKNLLNLLTLIVKDGVLNINWDDDIIKGIALTRDGAIIHPLFTEKK